MGLEDDIAFFERVPTLAVLGKQALRVLAIGAETRHLQSGAVLFYAGELADGGYIVQEGSMVVEPEARRATNTRSDPARCWANWRCSPTPPAR